MNIHFCIQLIVSLLIKIYDCLQNINNCVLPTDLKLLIMEAAPLGNFRQYLEVKANEMYYNVTSSKTLEMDFINQIIEASDAVHQLDVSKYVKLL